MEVIKDFNTIVYHNPCADGSVALWVANYYKEIVEKIPCKAGYNPFIIANNKNILFVDICPKFDYLFELCKTAKNVVIIDHHQTTLDAYEKNKIENEYPKNLKLILDMKKSGCQMTWNYFFETPYPWFVNYVGDKDLWLWKLPNSKEINIAFFENNMFDTQYLQNINLLLNYTDEQINDLVKEGTLILKQQKKQIDIASSRALEAQIIVDDIKYNVWLGTINSASNISELGNILANKPFTNTNNKPDFSAIWTYEPKTKEWWISLRGSETSPDLSKIAGVFGGGGHIKSSGFVIKYNKTLHDIFLIK
jgi:oligoribonuclease NrnB/cAMP/cGMP phosphodiesterase (DHH superfamily)